jgi:hypothetical protein
VGWHAPRNSPTARGVSLRLFFQQFAQKKRTQALAEIASVHPTELIDQVCSVELGTGRNQPVVNKDENHETKTCPRDDDPNDRRPFGIDVRQPDLQSADGGAR